MRILLISDDQENILKFIDLLENKEELKILKNRAALLRHEPTEDYDVIFCDLKFIKVLPFHDSDFSLSSTSLGYDPARTRFVLLTNKQQINEAMVYIRSGSLSYITKPLTDEEIIHCCHNTLPLRSTSLTSKSWLPEDASLLRSANPQMRTLYEQLRLVSLKPTTVLITGETGTGKGVLAQLLHHLSQRRDEPFVSVHCGAIPATLLESELFGHEKGSFTGALRQKKGRFEQASGGTIFLDEIGTISQEIQIKLLQVLQEKKVTRIGSEKSIDLDLRVVAATNEDLLELTQKGLFRKDLYYRLNVFPVHVPPLADRIEDLPVICASILHKLNAQHGKNFIGVDPLLGEALKNYPWPGNIRELENLFERAFILEESDVLTVSSFPAEILAHAGSSELVQQSTTGTLSQVRSEVVARVEEEYLRSHLSVNNGSIKLTATTAGITTRQLHKLMTKYAIDKNEYKVR